MNNTVPYVITISRMLGSGGLVIGKQLAERLNIPYFDKEILARAAEEFGLKSADLESHDEKPASVWELFLKSGILENPDLYIEPALSLPTDRQLYEAESDIIRNLAQERSSVIIGRCGSHILREHPHHISIFLHCSPELRAQRMQELFRLTEKDARKMIKTSDSNRAHHHQAFTGKNWTDSRHYTLTLDTGKIGLDESAEIILRYAEHKFGVERVV